MSPYLELVEIKPQESFNLWSHGLPYRTVRWHFHPEYELHLITHTSGRCFVGDHIGTFEPGQLVMTGPNLPHNWISDIGEHESVPERCLVLQFTGQYMSKGIATFPELTNIDRLLTAAQRGILFSKAVAAKAVPLMQALRDANGFPRLMNFLSLLDLLARSTDHQLLATPDFKPDPETYRSSTINQVLAHISEHLSDPLPEPEMAAYAGMTPSAFSRFFRRNTGSSYVQYLGQLRLTQACELLMNSDEPITEICYRVGFNNLSNFNRQFLAMKQMPPSQFRRLHRMNVACEMSG